MILIIISVVFWVMAPSFKTEMFPNVRTTLDDCTERFFRVEPPPGLPVSHGKPALITEFPHMAAIGWTNSGGTIQWNCGGSLVWYNFVLTAAHCVISTGNKPPDVVRLGDIDLNSSDDDKWAQQFKIEQIFRHPEYTGKARYHDVALLKLEKNVVETPYVIPACLWANDEIRFKTLVATGWGRTGELGDFSPNLQRVILKPISNEKCNKFYPTSHRLEQGLKDLQLCAVHELMDTCEGDSGGPLQVKLLHNGRITPFIVGVTSFGISCGISLPGVYIRVSAYLNWIVDTMRQNGAIRLEDNEHYNETFCAIRFSRFRDYYQTRYTVEPEGIISSSNFVGKDNESTSPNILVKIHWNKQGPDCYGVIIDQDTVLTVADCTLFEGKSPRFITYLDNKVMPILKTFVHPNIIRGTANNNIAILKLNNLLELPFTFQPSCIPEKIDNNGYTFMYGKGRYDMNSFLGFGANPFIAPWQSIRQIITFELNANSCVIPQKFLSRMTNGVAPEHLCFGHDVFLVPKSCDQLTGSMIGFYTGHFFNTIALSQFSQDCGFGEHLISTRLSSHMEWLKSILLPDYRDSSALHYVDGDLQEGDSCPLSNGLKGQCIPEDKCGNQLKSSFGHVTFCSSATVICCSPQYINMSSQIHPEIMNCPKLVEDLPDNSGFGAMATIGWLSNNSLEFQCKGSIISRTSIVTAASCLQDNHPHLVQLTESGVQLDVDSVLKHPGFNLTDRMNDIALIKLKSPLIWNSTIYPACLWTNMTHTPMEMLINYDPSSNLIEPKTHHPMYGSDCQRFYPYVIKDSQLCTRSPYESAICVSPGDQLGWVDEFKSSTYMGPDWNKFYATDIPRGFYERIPYLIGLSTNSCKLVKWKFSVFTRISAFLQWISENAF